MKISKSTNPLLTICRIFFVPCSEVVFQSGSDRFHKKVAFPEGSLWNEFYVTPDSAEFTETMKEQEHGMLFEQVLKFIYPGDSAMMALYIADLQKPMHILFHTSDGSYRLMGSSEIPAKLSLVKNIGAKSRQEITFSCIAQESLWWHDTPLDTVPE
jgi:hypothetical protein